MRYVWTFVGLAGLVFALTGCGQRMEKVEVETGYKGRARLNPFLAAWRLLESREWNVEERHGLTVLPGFGEVIVVSAESDQGGLAAQELASWIEEGGHVVYLLAGAERFDPELDREPKEDGDKPVRRDENLKEPRPKEESSEDEEEPSFPLLDEFGIRVALRTVATRSCAVGGRNLSMEMPEGLGVRIPKGKRQSPGVIRSVDRGPAGVASLPFGAGRLTVLGDARIWRNRHIGREDHATLFWEVMRLHGRPSEAWFLSDTRISFFGLLWSHGWMSLTGLAIFVVCWLWRSIPRFGPLLPDPAPASRDFTGHLSQAGAFLWSRAGADSLVTPIRQSILHRLSRHRAGATIQEPSGEQLEALVRATGLSVDRVQYALTGAIPRKRHRFIELISTLQKIDSACS